MSKDDMGASYYECEEDYNATYGLDYECTVCITKPGFIPYVASFGDDTYLQNENIRHNQDVFSERTYIGRNVTTSRPQGPVTLESGKLTIRSSQSTTIKNNFEVKKGAELDIITNNH